MAGPVQRGVVATATVGVAYGLTQGTLLQHGGSAAFWLCLAATACNPLCFIPSSCRGLTVPFIVNAWLLAAAGIAHFGDPGRIFEHAWRLMAENCSMWQIAVYGSAIVHITLTFVLNVAPVLVQNTPYLQRYKIQGEKKPPSVHDWYHCFQHIFASQLFVQLPLVTGLYVFMNYFQVPFDYDSMPPARSVLPRLACALMIDDAWVYFGHRALHDRRIYKYVHKVHHTYQTPFAPDAEYEHPIETAVLGVGFFSGCMLFSNHLVFIWAWLYTRLLVTYDSHSGYDLPMNVFHAIPWYNGAREHDWHHAFFNGNYAPTFLWWDRLFGTNAPFLKHERNRRTREAQAKGADFEALGDSAFASQDKADIVKAGDVDSKEEPVPFSTCLVTNSDCVLGRRLVSTLARRGAKKIICLSPAQRTPDFEAVLDRCSRDYSSTTVTFENVDLGTMATDRQMQCFKEVEVVFHIDNEANSESALRTYRAFLAHGGSAHENMVLVDCCAHVSRPSFSVDLRGDMDGVEHKLELFDLSTSGEVILEANSVKAASGANLATCAVSAHMLYAPEDEAFLATCRNESARMLGAGDTICSFTHADNAAHGMILSAAQLWLEGQDSPAAGQFFVVTDGGARSYWDAVSEVAEACGKASLFSKHHIPSPLLCIGTQLDSFGKMVTGQPTCLTPWTSRMKMASETFCTAKARRILGYRPIVSFDEGWLQMVTAAKHAEASDLKKKA